MQLVQRIVEVAAVGVHPNGRTSPLPDVSIDVWFLDYENGQVVALLPWAFRRENRGH